MSTSKIVMNKDRKLTDKSLIAERAKTNRSLSNLKDDIEEEIDKTVSEDRSEVDQAIEIARHKADARHTSTENTVEDEKKNSKKRIALEREQSDKAVKVERSQVDAALDKERKIKSSLSSQLLEQERNLTDKNLSIERSQSDLEVLRCSDLLTDEQSEHSKTKVSLTVRNEFLAIVSHDLRNPIGAAGSCADLLLEDPSFANMDPAARHWIKFIKRNVDVSMRMITDLLDMERMASGKLELRLAKHSIGKIIQQSVESFAHTVAAKKIKLLTTPIIGPDEVVCDFDRILQVLSNLIGNALKFTPEEKTITINATVTAKEVQVSIEDTGPGIPADKLGKIFERFTQLGSNDRRGLGLGLYISKMLIDAHGGQISVKSKINEGSTLCFTIPVADNVR